MIPDAPDPAQATSCASNKPGLVQRLRRRLLWLWTWLDRIDPARLIGGSDVFK
jgi:hypothetical protein